MLFILVLGTSLLAQVTAAVPAYNDQPAAQIITQDFDTAHLPNYYSYHYDATDGSSRTEKGAILNADTPDAALNVNGAVRWYNSKGQLYEMFYKAGSRGYNTIIRKVRS